MLVYKDILKQLADNGYTAYRIQRDAHADSRRKADYNYDYRSAVYDA